MVQIDINTDLGEGFGRWKLGDDEAMMKLVSSANVACGYHAGDAVIMHRCVELAKENGVALGAHVGLPDRLGFGRVEMDMDPEALYKHALYQLGALAGIAKIHGVKVVHASAHGAFGGMQRRNPKTVERVYDAFRDFDSEIMVAPTVNSAGETYARKTNMRRIGKIFADRAYDDEGLLISRKMAGSVINDLNVVRERMDQFLNDGTITTITGKRMKMQAKCVLIHSDTDGAVEIAHVVRATILSGGGEIVPMDKIAA